MAPPPREPVIFFLRVFHIYRKEFDFVSVGTSAFGKRIAATLTANREIYKMGTRALLLR